MRNALLAAPLLLSMACSEATPPEPAAPREHPLSQDGSAARAITSTPDRARIQVDLATVRAAVQTWRGERGTWPGSIEELGLAGLNYPADLTYDPATGRVASQTYPGY